MERYKTGDISDEEHEELRAIMNGFRDAELAPATKEATDA